MYVPKGWKEDDPVPLGQAFIAPIISRCYHIIHQTYGHRYAGAILSPIQQQLEGIVDQIKLVVRHPFFNLNK
jgi:hypothetical protein